MHILPYPPSRNTGNSCVSLSGNIRPDNRLLFGCSLAPRILCREGWSHYTERRDENEVFSLDDLLFAKGSIQHEEVALQTLHLVSHLSKPGFHNEFGEKLPSSLSDIHYLGVELNSATRARSCGSKWRNCSEISTGVSKTRTALSVTQLLGIRISWSRGDPHGSPPQEETPEVGHSLQKPAVLTYWVINCIARGIPLSQICLLQSTVMTTITAYHREASPTGE